MNLFGNIAEAVRDLATDPNLAGDETERAADPAADVVGPGSPLGEALHNIGGAIKDMSAKVLEATEATVEAIGETGASADEDVVVAIPVEADEADEIEATAATPEATADATDEDEAGEMDEAELCSQDD